MVREYKGGEAFTAGGGVQRWQIDVSDKGVGPKLQVTVSASRDGLEGVEEDETRSWYFVAPRELLGDWSEAYRGELQHERI